MGENPQFSRFLYILNPQKHILLTHTQKIFMDIFVPVVMKRNHPMQKKQRNMFRGLNLTLVACGNILNALKLKMFHMQTSFAHIAAKSWMM